jgi:Flp pilus assembly protein TadG
VTSSAVLVGVVLALFGAGAALAASGAGTLVTGGEGGAVNGRAAQQPLGDISATPNQVTGQGNVTPNNNTPNNNTPNQGTVQNQGRSNAAPLGVSAGTVVGSAGQTGSQLPFTGFLAMSVLLAGVALLLVGFLLRWRTPQRELA